MPGSMCFHCSPMDLDFPPIGTCIRCFVFACEFHGARINSGPKFFCISCINNHVMVSALNKRLEEFLARDSEWRSIIIEYLGRLSNTWESDRLWQFRSLEDFSENVPQYRPLVNFLQNVRYRSPENIFDFKLWREHQLLVILLQMMKPGGEDQDGFFALLLLSAALTKSYGIERTVDPALRLMAQSLKIDVPSGYPPTPPGSIRLSRDPNPPIKW